MVLAEGWFIKSGEELVASLKSISSDEQKDEHCKNWDLVLSEKMGFF